MRVYTTGQVSRICNVATSTVNKWFDSGQLKGYRVPGSRHRRIPRKSLIDFLKRNGVPLDGLTEETTIRVLIVAQDPVLVENFKRALSAEESFHVAVAASRFETGIQAETLRPDCILVDFSLGNSESQQICGKLRRSNATAGAILIGLLPDGPNVSDVVRPVVDDAFKQPFDPSLLAHRIRTLIGAKNELA